MTWDGIYSIVLSILFLILQNALSRADSLLSDVTRTLADTPTQISWLEQLSTKLSTEILFITSLFDKTKHLVTSTHQCYIRLDQVIQMWYYFYMNSWLVCYGRGFVVLSIQTRSAPIYWPFLYLGQYIGLCRPLRAEFLKVKMHYHPLEALEGRDLISTGTVHVRFCESKTLAKILFRKPNLNQWHRHSSLGVFDISDN